MNKKRLQQYLAEHAPEFERIVMQKAIEYQNAKNLNREAKKRWTEKKMRAAATQMYEKIIESIHAKVASTLSKNSVKSEIAWINKIEEVELIDSLLESAGEIEFD
ncbi:hypothetical protein NHG29_03995 [Aerococcaceae bacterium NML160702]|nr:hypothetical protein [Aerococcaceae bacterium NML160702]